MYSFAIPLWEMMALKTPYELYTMSKLRSRVWNGEQKRPFLDPKWPEPLKVLLTRSWNKEIVARPSFSEVTATLRKQCVEASGGQEQGLEHNRRRSTFIFAKFNLENLQLSEEDSVVGKKQ